MSHRSNATIAGDAFAAPLGAHHVASPGQKKADGHQAALNLSDAKISLQQAVTAAQQKAGGRAFVAIIEHDNGTPAYWIATVANGGHITHLLVDPMNGAVRVSPVPASVSSEHRQSASLAAAAKLDLTAAIHGAAARIQGPVAAASLNNENGQAVYRVAIASAGGIRQLKVDAATGKVTAVSSGMWLGFARRTLRQRGAI